MINMLQYVLLKHRARIPMWGNEYHTEIPKPISHGLGHRFYSLTPVEGRLWRYVIVPRASM